MAVNSLIPDLVQRNTPLSMAFLPFLLGVFMTVLYRRSPWRKLPPGPRGLPLIGNLHQIVHGKRWITFSDWKEIYGPIFYLNAAGQPIIVLGSLKVAADLLDRRALIYSDRPRNIVASDMMAGGMAIAFMHFNDLWKRMRKASHENLRNSASSKYHLIQVQEAGILTENLLANGKEWSSHFERAAGSFITSLVYGMPIHSPGEGTGAKAEELRSRFLTATVPGANLVEFFPWMRHIPASFAGWKRRALEGFKERSAFFEYLLDSAVERKANGDDRPNMAAILMQDAVRNQLSHLESSFLAGATYAAGIGTTTDILAWWLLAMLAYLETQKRAQEEIDTVVGRDRLPTFSDMKNMPYVQGMVKETLRWSSVTPLGLPHRLMEDDWYNGYFLPKNSIVIANIWGINRDPAIFGEDAHHFNPERHLDKKGQVAPAIPDTKEEGHVAYGFGRRTCVGRHVSNNTLFIYIATMLWAINIQRGKDEKGNLLELDVSGVVNRGISARPVPFDCKITPRSPDVLSILEGAKEN